MLLGLVASSAAECQMVLGEMRARGDAIQHGFLTGRLGGHDIVLVISGAGPASVAVALTRMIERHAPSAIIQIGIGGAYPSSGLDVGEVAMATTETYADLGAESGEGFLDMRTLELETVSKPWLKAWGSFDLSPGIGGLEIQGVLRRGPFLTVSTVTGTDARAARLELAHPGALVESMEGAAAAQVAGIYNLPMIELRGVSNIAARRDRAAWNVELAAGSAQRALLDSLL